MSELKNILLIDERNPRAKDVIRIDTSKAANHILFLQNIRNEREIQIPIFRQVEYRDAVKYLVLEGSTLTMLGLVEYDAQADRFQMTELTSVIAGGVDEARKLLDQRIVDVSAGAKYAVMLGTMALVLGGVAAYGWYSKNKRARDIVKAKKEAENSLRRISTTVSVSERGQPECLICMEHVANVVMVPCNHLCLCKACLIELRHSPTPNCPLCKLEIKYD